MLHRHTCTMVLRARAADASTQNCIHVQSGVRKWPSNCLVSILDHTCTMPLPGVVYNVHRDGAPLILDRSADPKRATSRMKHEHRSAVRKSMRSSMLTKPMYEHVAGRSMRMATAELNSHSTSLCTAAVLDHVLVGPCSTHAER
jgi:hypothetical protein